MAWTPERRKRQAEAIRQWKPWEKSTGPKTPEGMAHAARNSFKHGWRSKSNQEMMREIRKFATEAENLLEEIKMLD